MKIKQYKTARRLGARIFPKTQNPKFILNKRVQRARRPSPTTEYGLQLIEKQKVRYTYNLNERQFAQYVKKATGKKGINPVGYLYQTLEQRLDNVVFRLGFASTRPLARQMVSHGHITVNGRRVNIPSFRVSMDDRIAIRKESKDKNFSSLSKSPKEYTPPVWLSIDIDKREGVVVSTPVSDKSSEDLFNLTSVLEFYSR
ncbi:30S ribosomal protein S4 [bacterium]|nr:30S ribosomal protein S4 [bacterium]|tara:strand:+ start:177 stop:776 length:600 start_codon:yes stop_codon:yes gene_type:complete